VSEHGRLAFETYTAHVWRGDMGDAPAWVNRLDALADELIGDDDPASTPEPDAEAAPEQEPAQKVTAPQAPQVRRYAEPEAEEWNDPDELENFDFDATASVVKVRKRRAVDYQTLRINQPTSKIMRQVWLANRRIDPALSYTEFATLVVQRGLRGLKEDRGRD
jgi:hypothetical protein